MLVIKCKDDFEKAKAFAMSVGRWDNPENKNSLLWQLRHLAGYCDRSRQGEGWRWYENVDGELQLSQVIQKDCTGDIVEEKFGSILYSDFAPYSFGFSASTKNKDGVWTSLYCGGLIFHGAHDNGGDGSSPTFSVCLVATNGRSIHT